MALEHPIKQELLKSLFMKTGRLVGKFKREYKHTETQRYVAEQSSEML
jgi:hypothetical protein